MKKIHFLILSSFIRPFLVTFFIVMFVLLMLFLYKYIDDLVGKGFEWYVILELLGYQALAQISMAMPLSMLLSAIMTFGNLGESYELVAIKAAGISLRKAMIPLFILVGLFAAGAFLFSNKILPVVNLKMGSLLYDVTIKQADFLIKPGIFNNSIPNYSIRANDKSEDGKILYDIMIYDHSSGDNANNVLLAREGYMYNSLDQNYMILKLKDGVRYQENNAKNATSYNPRQQFTRFYFEETEQKFNMETFKLKRTDESLFQGHHAMLNLNQLDIYRDSTQQQLDSLGNTVMREIQSYYNYLNTYYRPGSENIIPDKNFTAPKQEKPLLEQMSKEELETAVNSAVVNIGYILNTLELKASEEKVYQDKIVRYDIEWQKKFTLAVSCLLLFAIGAPLGAIVRKGGLGAPVVLAIIFFLIYYILNSVSEKSAKEGNLEVVIGTWLAILILTPVAILLTYKASNDSTLFDGDSYKVKFEKLWNKLKEKFPFLDKKKID